jgi:benzodiazapine receptor
MKNLRLLVLFIVLTLGGGTLIGLTNAPGPWYEALAKPPFNPPNWVFGPTWTVLYIMIGIAGARIFARDARSGAMVAWWTQLALNFAWTPVFFTLQRPDLALAVIVPLFLSIVVFVLLSWRRDRLAALLMLPYACWVGFATVLNFEIWRLN